MSTSNPLFQYTGSVQTSKLIVNHEEDDVADPDDCTANDEAGYSACVSFIAAS